MPPERGGKRVNQGTVHVEVPGFQAVIQIRAAAELPLGEGRIRVQGGQRVGLFHRQGGDVAQAHGIGHSLQPAQGETRRKASPGKAGHQRLRIRAALAAQPFGAEREAFAFPAGLGRPAPAGGITALPQQRTPLQGKALPAEGGLGPGQTFPAIAEPLPAPTAQRLE